MTTPTPQINKTSPTVLGYLKIIHHWKKPYTHTHTWYISSNVFTLYWQTFTENNLQQYNTFPCFDAVFISVTRPDTMKSILPYKITYLHSMYNIALEKVYNLVFLTSPLGSWYQDTCAHHITELLNISHWKPTVL